MNASFVTGRFRTPLPEGRQTKGLMFDSGAPGPLDPELHFAVVRRSPPDAPRRTDIDKPRSTETNWRAR